MSPGGPEAGQRHAQAAHEVSMPRHQPEEQVHFLNTPGQVNPRRLSPNFPLNLILRRCALFDVEKKRLSEDLPRTHTAKILRGHGQIAEDGVNTT